MIHTLTQLNY